MHKCQWLNLRWLLLSCNLSRLNIWYEKETHWKRQKDQSLNLINIGWFVKILSKRFEARITPSPPFHPVNFIMFLNLINVFACLLRHVSQSICGRWRKSFQKVEVSVAGWRKTEHSPVPATQTLGFMIYQLKCINTRKKKIQNKKQ